MGYSQENHDIIVVLEGTESRPDLPGFADRPRVNRRRGANLSAQRAGGQGRT